MLDADCGGNWPAPRERNWCLFLDRDGVINKRIVGDYVRSTRDFEFLGGSLSALNSLARWAPQVAVVTNQQGVGKGLMSHADLEVVHGQMLTRIRENGGRVDAVLVCPHLASDGCACRKPGTGLVSAWLAEHPEI